MLIAAAIISKKVAKGYVNIKTTGEDNSLWSTGYYGVNPSGLGIVLLIAGLFFTILGMATFSIDIGNLFKWLIVPEIKYLEMLKGLMT